MARMRYSGVNPRAIASATARGVRRAMYGGGKKNNWIWYVGGALALYFFVAPVKSFVNGLFTKKDS